MDCVNAELYAAMMLNARGDNETRVRAGAALMRCVMLACASRRNEEAVISTSGKTPSEVFVYFDVNWNQWYIV